ncbi:MAG TPA: hypothetical protein VFA33_25820 [Bryobacteraceae bacterium]|nr:hypothetical protein [Bryobacteraceae bacterium]
MSEDVFRFVIAAGVVLAGIAFVVQAAVLLALYRVTKGGQDRFAPLAENAGPILSSTRNLLQTLDQNTPRINEIVQDISAVTHSAREQAARLNALVEDATTRATRRLAELDQTVDLAVEQVEQTGESVKRAVLRPLREVNAILIGVRTAVLTYAQGNRRPSVDHATLDEEMFI